MHPSSINCHRKQNSQKNKGPGSLTDTEKKTHKKKKKKKKQKTNKQTNKGPGSLTDTKNKTHQKKKTKKTKVQETTRTDRQTNKHVALIYKIVTHVTLC
jgi:hypothetical protein